MLRDLISDEILFGFLEDKPSVEYLKELKEIADSFNSFIKKRRLDCFFKITDKGEIIFDSQGHLDGKEYVPFIDSELKNVRSKEKYNNDDSSYMKDINNMINSFHLRLDETGELTEEQYAFLLSNDFCKESVEKMFVQSICKKIGKEYDSSLTLDDEITIREFAEKNEEQYSEKTNINIKDEITSCCKEFLSEEFNKHGLNPVFTSLAKNLNSYKNQIDKKYTPYVIDKKDILEKEVYLDGNISLNNFLSSGLKWDIENYIIFLKKYYKAKYELKVPQSRLYTLLDDYLKERYDRLVESSKRVTQSDYTISDDGDIILEEEVFDFDEDGTGSPKL